VSKGKSYLESLSPWKKSYFGMNITMKSSSKFKFSYHSYSSAYELDYSSRVMIVIYELVYSLCGMILTCRTLCLIIHITYMIRIRAKLRWWFIIPSGSFFVQIDKHRTGVWVVSLYTGILPGCTKTFGCDGAPRLRGRRQVVIALSIPCNPPCSGIRIGVRKVSLACWQTTVRRSPYPSYT
jgi:hypothetical protein